MFLDDATIARMGVVLGQHFTEGELTELADMISQGWQACQYAAEGLAERADFERKHHGSEEDDYKEAADGYSDTEAKLARFAQAIRDGEKQGREDHAL